jgi:raffinose/stachyose/melibiose transport system permease protein
MNQNYKTHKQKVNMGKVIYYIIMFAFSVVTLFPIYFAIISSFKNDMDIFLSPFSLPEGFKFSNYVRAFKIGNIGMCFINSLILTAGTVIITGLTGTLASYILAKFKFKIKNLIFVFFVAGMMIPIQTTIIPLAYTFGGMGLSNNYAVLILLFCAFQLPVTVFIVTGFQKSIPSEIEEAAVIDGCNPWQVFFNTIVPLSLPAISTASVFNFLFAWNNLLFPLVFISDKRMQVIALGLQSFFAEMTSDYGGVMAAIVISIMPPILAYIALQDKVEKGLTAGAVKG